MNETTNAGPKPRTEKDAPDSNNTAASRSDERVERIARELAAAESEEDIERIAADVSYPKAWLKQASAFFGSVSEQATEDVEAETDGRALTEKLRRGAAALDAAADAVESDDMATAGANTRYANSLALESLDYLPGPVPADDIDVEWFRKQLAEHGAEGSE